MKVAALVLLILNVIVALAATAFFLKFSIVESVSGEYLLLKPEQTEALNYAAKVHGVIMPLGVIE